MSLLEQVGLFECFPRSDGTLCRFHPNLPEWAGRNSCRVGKVPHLVGRDSRETAAAAEG